MLRQAGFAIVHREGVHAYPLPEGLKPAARLWARASNDLVHRVTGLFPKNFAPVCQLPQTPGGALDACAEEVLRDLAFEPSCSGTTALFTLDPEGLHAEVHQLAPAE